ncbi:unnamed protein product [Somion occarium]
MPFPAEDNRSFGPEQAGRIQGGLSYMHGHDHTSYNEHDYASKPAYRSYGSVNGVSEPQSSLSSVLGYGAQHPARLSSTGAHGSSGDYHSLPPSSVQTSYEQTEVSDGSSVVRGARPSEVFPTASPSGSGHSPIANASAQPQYSERSLSPPSEPRPLGKRKEKPRIALAPDQPLTTQGKPRARVYVACVQCRSRKIRCDGAKPICHNCTRKCAEGVTPECTYDPAPKRRGPDKVPGARQRTAQSTVTDGGKVRKRRRRHPEQNKTTTSLTVNLHSDATGADWTNQRPMRMEVYTGNPATAQSHASARPQGLSVIVSDLDAYKDRQASSSYHPLSGGSSNNSSPLQHVSPLSHLGETLPSQNGSYVSPSQHVTQYSQLHPTATFNPLGSELNYLGYVPSWNTSSVLDQNEYDEEIDRSTEIAAEPSLQFTRATWWDALLSLYARRTPTPELALSPGLREATTQRIISDIQFIFRASNFWFSFVNISRFFTRIMDTRQRQGVQPSLVLALLSLSTFMQSSEREGGAKGRSWALRLRDEAQSALEASLNGRWIDESLVHASWLLAFFEISAHPAHSTNRVRSAMSRLDSLLRSMALCSVDKDDPRVTRFGNRVVPAVSPRSQTESLPHWNPHHHHHHHVPRAQGHPAYVVPSSPSPPHCSCTSFTLGHNSPIAKDVTPLWLTTPAWPDSWTEGEIRKEECRRIVWSSMTLTAGHSSYTAACNGSAQMDLFISNPANYTVLFPGESLMPAASPDLAKETVWALYMRSMLLWHSCVRMRLEPEGDDATKAQFAVGAWLEIDRIEEALSKHTCNIERAFLFQGREFLFNARMCISHEFRRYIPQAAANANFLFHRQKAEEWLKHQAAVAEQVMYGLQTVTGQPNVSITRRSFFLFWFMSQVSRALTLWTCDNSLTVALEMSKTMLAPIEYLMSLWPCPAQQIRYRELREQLNASCRAAGIPPPSLDSSSLFLPLG